MNNQLWILVAVAGVVAAAALWRGWLWVRKKARLSEQFQRDVRKEIDSLRQHVMTLEEKELDSVRQQVKSLDARQSREEIGRLEETSGLRARLDGLSTKESESQMREALGAVRQKTEDLEARQSREESSRLEEISGLRIQLDGLGTKESESQMREALGAIRQKTEDLEARQSREKNSWTEEISGLRARLDGLGTKESESQMREALGAIRQKTEDLEARQSRDENNQVKEIIDLHTRLEGTKESEVQIREELSVVRQQVGEIREEQTRGKIRADLLLTEETGTRLGEMFGKICQHLGTILDTQGKHADVVGPSEKRTKKEKESHKSHATGELATRKEPGEEKAPSKSWDVSYHRVCLLEESTVDRVKHSIARALELEERNDGLQKLFVGKFSVGEIQMREGGIGTQRELIMSVRATDAGDEIEERTRRVLDVLCEFTPSTDVNLGNLCSHHFLLGEAGAEVLLDQMGRQDRGLSLVVLSQGPNRKWSKDYMSDLCAEFAGEATVIRLDMSASVHLVTRLGQDWSCGNGDVRIYRPGWHGQDNTRKHHLFPWKTLGQKIFEKAIEPEKSFSDIRAKLPKDAPVPGPERKPDAALAQTPKKPTVQQMVEQAMKDFESGLLFGDGVSDGVLELDATAGPPDKVYRHLSVLNDLAKIKQCGESLGCDEIQWLRDRNLDVSRESESDANSGLCRWSVGGNPMEFNKHVKPNTHTSRAQCVRIYYEWDEQQKQIVIGMIGRHQR